MAGPYRVHLTNEDHQPLVGVQIEAFNLDSPTTIEAIATTDVGGIAVFEDLPDTGRWGFRPRVRRHDVRPDQYGEVRLLVFGPTVAGCPTGVPFTADDIYDPILDVWTAHTGAEGQSGLEGACAGDPANPGTAYYVYLAGAVENRLARTQDGGLTWNSVALPAGADIGTQFRVDAGGRIWLANYADDKIYYSDDQGDTWTVGLDLASVNASTFGGADDMIVPHPTDQDKIMLTPFDSDFVADRAVVLVSTDRGDTWTRRTVGTASDILSTGLAAWLSGGRILYSLELDTDGDLYEWYSDDEGATWTLIEHLTENLDHNACRPAYSCETDFFFIGTRNSDTGVARIVRVDGSTTPPTVDTFNIGVAGNVLRALVYTDGVLYVATDDGDFYGVPDATEDFTPETLADSDLMPAGHDMALIYA